MDLKTILEERATVLNDMKKVVNHAMSENRAMDDSEQQQYDKMNDRVSELTSMKQTAENLRSIEDKLEGVEFKSPVEKAVTEERQKHDTEKRYNELFEKYLRRGYEGMLPDEVRQMKTDTATKGEAFVTTTFSDVFVRMRDQFNVVRQFATSYPLGAHSHEIAVETALPTASWVGEGDATSASEPTSAKKTLSAHKMTCLVKVSDELMADSRFPIQTMLAEQMGRAMGNKEESGFLRGAGSGSNEPEGLLNNATLATTTAANDAITRAEVMDTYYALPRQYRENAKWILSDDALAAIRAIVTNDGGSAQGNTMWQAGLREGEPDTILGRPCYSSGGCGNLADSGAFIGGIFDMGYYAIGDRQDFSVKRLEELYAVDGLQGFLASLRVDGLLTVADSGRSIKSKA